MTLPPDFYTSPAEREQLRVELAMIVAAHPGYTWTDRDGPCSGSKVVCNGPACTWEMDLDGTSADTRRALHPAHVARELEPTILAFADTIRLRQESKPAAAT